MYSFKRVNIIFPGGCGGNHIANMLSLDERFAPRFASDSYVEDMLKNYSTFEYKLNSPIARYAHFFESFGLVKLLEEDFRNEVYKGDKIHIFAGHAHHFVLNDSPPLKYLIPLVEKLTDTIWIMLNLPKDDSMPAKRIISLNQPTLMKSMYTWPFNTNAPFPHYRKVTDKNGILLDADILFSESGSVALEEKLNEKWGIKFHPVAHKLHQHWYKWVVYSIEELEANK